MSWGSVNTLRCTRNTPSSRLSSTRLSSAVCSMVDSSDVSGATPPQTGNGHAHACVSTHEHRGAALAQELLTDLRGKLLHHRLGLLADYRLAKFPDLAEQVGFQGDAHFGLDRPHFTEIHAQMCAHTATQATVLGLSPHGAMPLLTVAGFHVHRPLQGEGNRANFHAQGTFVVILIELF